MQEDEHPEAMAVFSIMSRVGGIFSPIICGFMMSHIGNQGFLVWLLLTMGMAIGVLLVAKINKKGCHASISNAL